MKILKMRRLNKRPWGHCFVCLGFGSPNELKFKGKFGATSPIWFCDKHFEQLKKEIAAVEIRQI